MIRINVDKHKKISSEITERKGLGHPDTLCDLLAESLSLELSRYYLENFGMILHHNVDKLLLVGGKSEPEFQGGKIIQPIDLFYAGRASMEFKGKKVPLDDILHLSLEKLLNSRFRFLKKENFKIHNFIRPGSNDLVELFERGFVTGEFFSNDTSCGVGYGPLSALEKAVLDTERYLNSPEFKNTHPEVGEDIKIMGLLQNDSYIFTAGVAFIDAHINNIDDYKQKKDAVEKLIYEKLKASLGDCEIRVNTGDNYTKESIFMTVTGTSAESGDDGEVGRGNRANGLISPYSPMTMEAICGKNPVTHTGKLYNWIAMEIAEEVGQLQGIHKCKCYLVSRIGHPISKPWYIDIMIETSDEQLSEANRDLIEQIVHEKLTSLKTLGLKIVREGLLLVK